MIGRAWDNLIGVFAPGIAARNAYQRRVRSILAGSNRHESMDQMLGTSSGAYEAGNIDRTNRQRSTLQVTENEVDRANIDAMRGRSWRQWRNNPQARKIVRSLQSKVIGRSVTPHPRAIHEGGDQYEEFNKRCKEVWALVSNELDYRGKPGRGGQTIVGLHKTALAASILSGGVLFRFRRLNSTQQRRKRTTLPLTLQLIHLNRLDSSYHDPSKRTFYGIEMTEDNERVAYHVLKTAPGEINSESVRVPAEFTSSNRCQMGHLFIEDDVDQADGVPWLEASIPRASIRNGYEIAEAEAAEAAACIVMGVRRSAGHSGGLGLPNPELESDRFTDTNGNPITHLQPKMIVDLGAEGSIEGFNPQRPNSSASEFIGHMIRSEAAGVPGVKGSTLTGDYRRSSFSSERAADNDIWPELEQIQEWFYPSFTQVIYEEVIIEAVEAGLFDQVPGFSADDFRRRMAQYLRADWQGPVSRSINPKDDALASKERVRNGQSSPQREASAVGHSFEDILNEFEDVIRECGERGLPDSVWQTLLGLEATTATAGTVAEPADPDQPDEDDVDEDIEDRLELLGMV